MTDDTEGDGAADAGTNAPDTTAPETKAPETKAPQTKAPSGPPQINISHQYVKDISFESPNSPQSLMPGQKMPNIEVNFDVQARPASDGRFEISLRITADATNVDLGAKVFVVEVVYAGMFALQNIPEEHVHATCLIECPRLLFPYARRVVSDLTRDGGFPPLMLDPIDFSDIYRHNMERQQAEAQSDGPSNGGNGNGDGDASSSGPGNGSGGDGGDA
jgi:preprotein translocase subunit SecB